MWPLPNPCHRPISFYGPGLRVVRLRLRRRPSVCLCKSVLLRQVRLGGCRRCIGKLRNRAHRPQEECMDHVGAFRCSPLVHAGHCSDPLQRCATFCPILSNAARSLSHASRIPAVSLSLRNTSPPYAILPPLLASVCLCKSVLLRQGKFSPMKPTLKNEDIAGKLKTFKGFFQGQARPRSP